MSEASLTPAPARPGRPGKPVPRLEGYLAEWLDGRSLPGNLAGAIRYALLGPGKRLRPVLTIRSCQAVGGSEADALAPAAAIEMIHAFSLVHDDLPALDDDDLRRGRPTLHRRNGEAMAILAGDALLGLAVELLVDRLPAGLAVPVCREIIEGCNRMIVGQVYDTLPGSHDAGTALEQLRTTHRNKTGALIRAACRAGAICGRADGRQLGAVADFGEAIGLMFQVVDDLLDVTGTTEQLGKTAGKDAARGKLTYPALLGVEASRREVRRLRDEALAALEPLGERAMPLRELCDHLSERTR
jgi:geranylgeranyl diphosphate synthase type II